MDRMIDIKKTVNAINRNVSAQWLFLLALAIYLTGAVLSSTMFPIPGICWKLCRLTAIGLIVWKVVQFDCFTMRETIFIAFLFTNVLLVKAVAGYSEPLYWAIFLTGAKDVSFEKILKSYFVISLSIILFAFAASMLEVIENLQYETDTRGIRNSFGIIYPTDFAAHIFFLMLVFLYLRKERVKIHNYIICMFITVLVYHFCKTRLDSICMGLLIVGHMFIKYRTTGKKSDIKKRKKWSLPVICGMCSMPAGMVIMWILTKLYDMGVPVTYDIDRLISNRLRLQSHAVAEYGIRIFGQYIKMVGNGGSETLPADYFFIDCSYYFIILQYGLVFGVLVFAVYILCSKKYRLDSYFQLVIMMIAINCMIAHHLLELAYNPFAFALFAKASYQLKDNKISVNGRLNMLF